MIFIGPKVTKSYKNFFFFFFFFFYVYVVFFDKL
jgi:hypothetical protein